MSKRKPRVDRSRSGHRPGQLVVKRSGAIERYRPEKLRRALFRVGVPRPARDHVVAAVEQVLTDGITSAAIDQVVARSLRRAAPGCATRWNLRRALLELGPSGFPFERFVAEVFAAEGYRTAIGVRLQGRFIGHEIDVVAERRSDRALCECKFVTRDHGKIDAKTAMYVYGRAVDLAATAGHTRFWLVTNGRFTVDASRFGIGMGLRLLGWDFPAREGLRERIERAGVMPISALVSLPKPARTALMRGGYVLCRDLVDEPGLLERFGVSAAQRERVIAEARAAARCLVGDSARS